MFLEGNQKQVCACLCYSLPTVMTVKAQLRNQTIAYKCGGAVDNFQISSSIASKMLLKFFSPTNNPVKALGHSGCVCF